MRNGIVRSALITAVATAATAGTLSLGTAAAIADVSTTTGSAATAPETSLILTIQSDGQEPRTTTLTCEPAAGGYHPNAETACTDLDRTAGAFEQSKTDTICAMVYSPVTVSATGRWESQPRQFTKTYGNACALHARTGTVFGF